ncbi:MAG: hypothetical protein DSY47_03140, partial [Hydrogenothermus sp.]
MVSFKSYPAWSLPIAIFIKNYLIEKGYEVIDKGTNSKESVDYPIFGENVA